MDHHRVAEILSDALGRNIRYEAESMESFSDRLGKAGLSDHFIQHITSVYSGYQDGEFAGHDDTVERITGRMPMSVREYVVANRERFGAGG
jgi:hypothetical protein